MYDFKARAGNSTDSTKCVLERVGVMGIIGFKPVVSVERLDDFLLVLHYITCDVCRVSRYSLTSHRL